MEVFSGLNKHSGILISKLRFELRIVHDPYPRIILDGTEKELYFTLVLVLKV